MLKSKQNRQELIKYFMLDFLVQDGTTPQKNDEKELMALIDNYASLIEDKQLKELFSELSKNLKEEFMQNKTVLKELAIQKYANDMLEVMGNFSTCTNSKKLKEQAKEKLIFSYLSLHSKEEPNL